MDSPSAPQSLDQEEEHEPDRLSPRTQKDWDLNKVVVQVEGRLHEFGRHLLRMPAAFQAVSVGAVEGRLKRL